MGERVLLVYPYLLAGATCVGLAAADAVRVHGGGLAPAAAVGAAFVAAFLGDARARVAMLAAGLALAGWWWGSARLDAIDSSVLLPHVGEAEPATVVVTGPARTNGFELRVPARILRFGSTGPARSPRCSSSPSAGRRLRERSSRSTPGSGCRGHRRTGSTSAPGFDATASMSSWWPRAGASSVAGAGSAGTRTGCARGSPGRSRPG